MKYTLNKVADWVGFSAENALPDSEVKVYTRALLISDDPDFYRAAEQISKIYLAPQLSSVDSIHRFLVVIHANLSADVYVNDIDCQMNIRPKRDLKRGELILTKDLADLTRVTFPSITFSETDKVIYCFKVGWRFGLFYDLTARIQPAGAAAPFETRLLDIENLYISIASLYRQLLFYHVYKTLESDKEFLEIVNDGWFPFVEIASDEFKTISEAYQDKFDFENRMKSIVEKFTSDRILTLISKWWRNPLFLSKQKLIEAGVKAYLQGSDDSMIYCIKTLVSEIEGVLRNIYFQETGKGDRVKSTDFIEHIIQKAKQTSRSEFSLLLPLPFLHYLKEILFASFNVETGEIQLSRHSALHGVADAKLYTRERALQLILVLDQIYYCA